MLVLGGITSVQLVVLILALSSDQHGDGNSGIGNNTTCNDMCDSSRRRYNMDEYIFHRFSIVGSSLCDASKHCHKPHAQCIFQEEGHVAK